MRADNALLRSKIRKSLSRYRYWTRGYISQYPFLYRSIARIRRHTVRRRKINAIHVSEDTDLLIEGFPKSANSFAVAAFRSCQTEPIRISSHVHAPAEVITAVRLDIPALVLIRDPEETVLSVVVRRPDLELGWVLREYVRYYRRVQPYNGGFLVATFDDITTDLGIVTRRLNNRFGTEFEEFQHTRENVTHVFQLMDNWSIKNRGFLSACRPSDERKKMKQELRRSARYAGLHKLREEAYDLWGAYRSYAGV